MAKTITFSLSTRSIGKAIKELEEYKKSVERKTQELARRVAELLETKVSEGFGSASADIYFNKESSFKDAPDCTIGMDGDGNSYVVWSSGDDAIFVEFGTGVYHNGSAGSSPHPQGEKLGFTIGSYEKGLGKRKTWGFKRDGVVYLTHGIPAAMPMYNAAQAVAQEIESIAKEVFAS